MIKFWLIRRDCKIMSATKIVILYCNQLAIDEFKYCKTQILIPLRFNSIFEQKNKV